MAEVVEETASHGTVSEDSFELDFEVGDLCLARYGDGESKGLFKGLIQGISDSHCEVKWLDYEETSQVECSNVFCCQEFHVPAGKLRMFRIRHLIDFAAEKTKTMMNLKLEEKVLDVAGRKDDLTRAIALLQTIVDTFSVVPYNVPADKVGKLMGAKGATKDTLQQEAGAVLSIPLKQPDQEEVTVSIIGDSAAIDKMKEAVGALLEGRNVPFKQRPREKAETKDWNDDAEEEQPRAFGRQRKAVGPSQTIHVDPRFIPLIIGTKGATIKDLQARTGARLDVSGEGEGGGQIRISGSAEAIASAVERINEIVGQSPGQRGSAVRSIVVPAQHIPAIIGPGGSVIRELESRSGARLKVSRDTAGEIQASGTEEQVEEALRLVHDIVDQKTQEKEGGEEEHPEEGPRSYGRQRQGGPSHTIHVEPRFIPFIIGTKGATIKDLQTRTGARLDVSREDDGQIRISGSKEAIASAVECINEMVGQRMNAEDEDEWDDDEYGGRGKGKGKGKGGSNGAGYYGQSPHYEPQPADPEPAAQGRSAPNPVEDAEADEFWSVQAEDAQQEAVWPKPAATPAAAAPAAARPAPAKPTTAVTPPPATAAAAPAPKAKSWATPARPATAPNEEPKPVPQAPQATPPPQQATPAPAPAAWPTLNGSGAAAPKKAVSGGTFSYASALATTTRTGGARTVVGMKDNVTLAAPARTPPPKAWGSGGGAPEPTSAFPALPTQAAGKKADKKPTGDAKPTPQQAPPAALCYRLVWLSAIPDTPGGERKGAISGRSPQSGRRYVGNSGRTP